ncbi:hypothetical protein F5880DRAFT_1616631 [Lentinula raphanica]|nr:hypothetical protein F5880DRAFT_1616631 [Lentinula raphanica]
MARIHLLNIHGLSGVWWAWYFAFFAYRTYSPTRLAWPGAKFNEVTSLLHNSQFFLVSCFSLDLGSVILEGTLACASGESSPPEDNNSEDDNHQQVDTNQGVNKSGGDDVKLARTAETHMGIFRR